LDEGSKLFFIQGFVFLRTLRLSSRSMASLFFVIGCAFEKDYVPTLPYSIVVDA
jgi:hypothetical protein